MTDDRKRPKHKMPRGSLNVWEFRERVDVDGCEIHFVVEISERKNSYTWW